MTYSKSVAKQAWSDKTEHRVVAASSAMTQLLGINAIGLASVVATHIQELHDAEVQCSFYDRKLRVTTHIIDVFAESVTPMLVLIGSISWLAFPSLHSTSEVFAIMSLVYLVSCAMTTILLGVSRLVVTIACFDNIERFTLREPVKGLSTDFNVSIQFAPGGVTMVHGRAGCGKSSLIKVLLGEKRLDEGIVTMPPGPGGYCNETPWLVGKDVRANILGQHEYVEEWYERIAWACLISEAEEWPDKKRIQGEDNDLDVGQKLRVQLARAAYGRPNILILDDPCRGLEVISISLFYLKFAPALSRSLHQDLVKFVFGAKTAYLSKTETPKLIGFFGQDMSLLSHDLPRSLLEVVYLATLVMCDLFIVSSCNIYIISIAAMFPATIFGMKHHYLGIYRRVQSLTQDAAAPLLAHFEHTAQGIIHIRAMRWESAFLKRCHKLIDESLRLHYALYCMECWFHLVIDMFVAFLATICIGTSLCMAGAMSETSIGLTMLTLVSFGPILCRLFEEWVKLQPSLAALNRLKLLAEAPTRMATETTQIQHKRDYSDWKTATGRLDLYAVTAAFDGSQTDSDVVRNVSLQLPSAAKLAIIGPPGSGKSALLLSILTLLDYAGTIYIDGTNVQAIPLDVLRASIITLPQGGVELPGSIRRNMDPWATPQHSFSDAEMHAVLKRVGLDELVQSRGGLSTDFASASLSKGEKQLLFLARAILRKEYLDARLVLVDDVTSGIDDETADRIQEIIETAFVGCTCCHGD
ncbi:hypothetical protein MY11210_007353 [Beauveria gryllotalpidicola]